MTSSQKLRKTILTWFVVIITLSAIVFGGIYAALAKSAKGYEIEQYNGHLTIAADNTALFTQEIVYRYDDQFNGQYVTLGEAGNMPQNFEIEADKVTYEVYKNDRQVIDPRVEMEFLGDGYRLKIYNGVNAGDEVRVVVHWPLESPLFSYQDVAELNWVPISDWEVPLKTIKLRVSLPQEYSGQVYAHTGYFGIEPNISHQSSSYEIKLDHLPANRKLELHAYWDKALLSQVSESELIAENRKPYIEQTERNIERNTQIARQLVYWYVPGISILVLVAVAITLYRQYKKLEPVSQMMTVARLYEPPGDLPPMHLAAQVYSVELSEANPVKQTNTNLAFNHIVQASLMDLIDRGNLTLEDGDEDPVLVFSTDRGLSESEYQLLDMAFGGEDRVAISELFKDYVMDDDWLSQDLAKTSSDEKKIRQQGQELMDRYTESLETISTLVSNEAIISGEDNFYRPLTDQENSFFWRIGIFSVLCLLATLGTFVYFLLSFGDFHWHLLILSALSLVTVIAISLIAKPYFRDGVLTRDGVEVFQLWQAFRNMVTELKAFDRTELEAIVLWNRLLVYATLFGEAKQVSKVLKLHKIHLPNPDLDHFVYHGHFNTMNHRMGLLSTSASTAVQDSNFSISSNSSSGGGFSGGGFSGGGGGGGGGSF